MNFQSLKISLDVLAPSKNNVQYHTDSALVDTGCTTSRVNRQVLAQLRNKGSGPIRMERDREVAICPNGKLCVTTHTVVLHVRIGGLVIPIRFRVDNSKNSRHMILIGARDIAVLHMQFDYPSRTLTVHSTDGKSARVPFVISGDFSAIHSARTLRSVTHRSRSRTPTHRTVVVPTRVSKPRSRTPPRAGVVLARVASPRPNAAVDKAWVAGGPKPRSRSRTPPRAPALAPVAHRSPTQWETYLRKAEEKVRQLQTELDRVKAELAVHLAKLEKGRAKVAAQQKKLTEWERYTGKELDKVTQLQGALQKIVTELATHQAKVAKGRTKLGK
jgi:hypothetical protein